MVIAVGGAFGDMKGLNSRKKARREEENKGEEEDKSKKQKGKEIRRKNERICGYIKTKYILIKNNH